MGILRPGLNGLAILCEDSDEACAVAVASGAIEAVAVALRAHAADADVSLTAFRR